MKQISIVMMNGIDFNILRDINFSSLKIAKVFKNVFNISPHLAQGESPWRICIHHRVTESTE
jgi:hypothetical protein